MAHDAEPQGRMDAGNSSALRAHLRATLTVGAAVLGLMAPAPVAAQTPLDLPVPANPTLADILAKDADETHSIVPGPGTCRSAPHRPVSLPADDAPHNQTQLESWWWYGNLTAQGGHAYSYVIAFAARPTMGFYAVDYTLTDLADGTHHVAREALIPGQPGVRPIGFVLRGKHARAEGSDGRVRLRFTIDGDTLDLRLGQVKPPVMMFGDGHASVFCHSIYVYSRVRQTTTGTLLRQGRRSRLSGTSALHHQWGFFPAEMLGLIGYDWLTFELDDGRDVATIVGSLKQHEELNFHTGYISDAHGHVTTLHRGDFTLTPTRFWRRDSTCSYPVEWDVDVKGERFHARAAIDYAELRWQRQPALLALWPSWAATWDGATSVTGAATGRGTLDMLGYCLA